MTRRWLHGNVGQRRSTGLLARGFTLIEVLVALLIMAVLAGLAWQGVDAMVRTRDISQGASERSLRYATVLAQWEQDLQSIYDAAAVPALAFDGTSLRLTRRTEDGVQLVVWALRDGIWQRWSSPNLTRVDDLQQVWLRSQQFLGSEAGQIKLVDGRSAWQLYFYRGNSWSNAQSSASLAPTVAVAPPAGGASGPATSVRQREQLPTGVRLVVDFGQGRLTRDVLLAPQMP
jgi:general secretion pathway protein J